MEKLKEYEPRQVILFGSYARDDVNEGSDIDLIIIKDTEDGFWERIEQVLELCKDYPTLEPLVYTPKELEKMVAEGNDFILTALEEGKVLYEQ